MRTLTRTRLTAVFVAWVAAVASATPVHPTMLPQVVQASNVIVAGRVLSQKPGRELAPFTLPMTMKVQVLLLGSWLASPDVGIRRELARILRGAASVEAGLVLARVGLDDPDQMVRYFSVGGLMAAFADGHYPAVALYKRNEHRYLDPWLAWRDANREAIAQGRFSSPPAPPLSSASPP